MPVDCIDVCITIQFVALLAYANLWSDGLRNDTQQTLKIELGY
jgi:hypothetical protein